MIFEDINSKLDSAFFINYNQDNIDTDVNVIISCITNKDNIFFVFNIKRFDIYLNPQF